MTYSIQKKVDIIINKFSTKQISKQSAVKKLKELGFTDLEAVTELYYRVLR